MFTYILLGLLGLAVYLQIGRLIGKLSWWVWQEEDWTTAGLPKLFASLLFPITFTFRNDWCDRTDAAPLGPSIPLFEDLDEGKTIYLLVMAVFWPLKLALNAIPATIVLSIGILRLLTFGPTWLKRVRKRPQPSRFSPSVSHPIGVFLFTISLDSPQNSCYIFGHPFFENRR